jgi:hypothetical protein
MKLVQTFVVRGVAWSVQRIPTAVTISFKEPFRIPQEAEWTPFQALWFSENLETPGIEPGTSGSADRNFDH